MQRRFSSLQYTILASGLVHLGLFAFLIYSPVAPSPALDLTQIEYIESVEPVRTQSVTRIPSRPKSSATASVGQQKPSDQNANTEESDSQESSGPVQAVRLSYEAEVARLLNARKRYPEMARRLRQQGRVGVRFKVQRDGQLLAFELIEPSVHSSLNEAARRLIQDIGNFKPFPAQIKAITWVMTVPIEYKL